MSIAGPKVQLPTALDPLMNDSGALHPHWQTFFNVVQQVVFAATRSGGTASRPTNLLDGRYIGTPYFDTDLGLTVYLKSVSPDVWVKGDGTPV